MRDDDAFWAARRVMAFSDEMIRAIVKTGQFSDPKAEEHLANVLIKRRNKIGQAYLTGINPVVSPALDASGTLTFANAAVDAGFAKPPAGYKVAWSRFDNTTGQATAIAETSAAEPRVAAPPGLPTGDAYVRAEISCVDGADASWAKPVDVYFRRDGSGWKLVGLERLPAIHRSTSRRQDLALTMQLEPTEEQRDFEAKVAAFATESLLPVAASIDERSVFPREVVGAAAGHGLLGVTIPQEWGGLGLDYVSYALGLEAVARASATVAVILSVNNSLVAEVIAEFGSDEQKQRWLRALAQGKALGAFALSEADAGTDAANQQTRATVDGFGYRLSGRKVWVANAEAATVAVVFAADVVGSGRAGHQRVPGAARRQGHRQDRPQRFARCSRSGLHGPRVP